MPFDPREVLARVVDGSRFDEYKPLYGTSLVTGWASIHGYPVGVLANAQGVLFMDEAKKATEFILLANQTDTPLVFLQNTTGYMVGKEYEQAGMIKDGAKMINAVTNSAVPHLTVIMGASYGAGNYGMCGRAVRAPVPVRVAELEDGGDGSRSSSPACCRSSPGRVRPRRRSRVRRGGGRPAAPHGRGADRARVARVLQQRASIYDDGIIDPRDTRTVLGIALSAVHSNDVEGRRGFGVFRM